MKAVNNKLKTIGIKEYVTDIFTAEEAGHMKPRHEFFQGFFKKINDFEKDDIIIIGDELDKDIAGGNNNGFDSCWLNMKSEKNNTKYKPTYEIKDLSELRNIL